MKNRRRLIVLSFILFIMIHVYGQDSLRFWAGKLDKTVGSAVEGYFFENGFWEGSERNYNKILTGQFNGIVAGNEMKMGAIHPEIDSYNFTKGDILVNYAQDHGMMARGHTLIWHNQNPSWFNDGEFTRDSLLQIMEDHITTIVSRYKGKIKEWDVVNEVIEWDGSLRKNKWQQVIGDDYIDSAFVYAHRADPDALLFINDYGNETKNSKSDGTYDLVKRLLENDIPVHGVGMQCHFTVGQINFNSIRANMERFNELGLITNFTEIDIRIHEDSFFSQTVWEEQAEDYVELLSVMLNNDLCTVFMVWGFSDNDSWIPGHTGGEYGQACLYDLLYQPKPAYHALLDTLKARNGVFPVSNDIVEVNNHSMITIMPNPVKKEFIVHAGNRNITFKQAGLYDLKGNKIKSYSTIQTGIPLSMTDIGEGIYFLRLLSRQGQAYHVKIIKQ